MKKLIFWFEFASTYSYLSAMRIEELAREAEIEIIWRPFLLGPIFQKQGWATSPFSIYEAKGRNMWRDMEGLTHAMNLPPFVKPEPFPQHSVLAAKVATFGSDQSWGPSFIRNIYTAQFAKGLAINDPDVVAKCLKEAGQDGPSSIAHATTGQSVKDRLRATTTEAQSIGLYGAPSFTTEDDELFWGNDRLEQAIAWANSNCSHRR